MGAPRTDRVILFTTEDTERHGDRAGEKTEMMGNRRQSDEGSIFQGGSPWFSVPSVVKGGQ